MNKVRNVLVTMRHERLEDRNETRSSIDNALVDLLAQNGYRVFLLPNILALLPSYLHKVQPDLILLSGGEGLKQYDGPLESDRDAIEKRLIEYALEKNVRLVGLCRGMQVLLDHFGERLEMVTGHVGIPHWVENGHNGGMEVNSFHNYGIKTLVGNVFEVDLVAADGVIEAISHRSKPIHGIMWHPERAHGSDAYFLKLIKP